MKKLLLLMASVLLAGSVQAALLSDDFSGGTLNTGNENNRTYGVSLKTASLEKDKTFSIAVVADPQYANTNPRGSRSPRKGLPRLKHAVSEWNKRNIDWGIILGDYIDWDDADYSKIGKSPALPALPAPLTGTHDWTHTTAILDAFQQLNAPTYALLGNHEFYVPDKDADGLSKPYSVYRKYGFDQKAYYSFRHKGFRFIALEIDWRYHNHDARGAPNNDYSPPKTDYEVSKAYYEDFSAWKTYWWNGAISIKQRLWLMDLLDESAALGEKVVCMAHDPLAPAPNPHHDILNKFEILAILNGYPNVVMWLDGHDHRGGYELQNNRHHLNLSGLQNTANVDSWFQMDFAPDTITLYKAEETNTPERIMNIALTQPTVDAPSGFAVTNAAGDALLTWDAEPAEATAVVIDRRHITPLRAELPSTAQTLAWQTIHTDTALTTQSYTDNPPNPVAEYKYRIRFLGGTEGSLHSQALAVGESEKCALY